MRIFDAPQDRLQFVQHCCRIRRAFWQKIFWRDFRFVNADDILNPDLHLSLIERRLAAHSYEIVLAKAASQIFRALPHLGFDLTAPIKKLEREITATVLGNALML